MQASTSRRNTSKRNNSPSSYSSPERNKQFLLDRFLESIKSEVTKSGVVAYINAYMRYWHLYEEEEKESQEQDLLNHNGNKKKNNSNIVGGIRKLYTITLINIKLFLEYLER